MAGRANLTLTTLLLLVAVLPFTLVSAQSPTQVATLQVKGMT